MKSESYFFELVSLHFATGVEGRLGILVVNY